MTIDYTKRFLIKLFKEPSSNHLVQIFRYMIAGFSAFIVDTSVLFLLTDFLHIYYLLSTIFAFLIGLLVSYLINIYWVFNKRKKEERKVEIMIFVIISIVGLLLTLALMWLFTSIFKVYYLYSKILTTLIVLAWNFSAKKKILF